MERKGVSSGAQTHAVTMNPTEAAQYLGMSRSWIDKARVFGTVEIPYAKIGRRVVYLKRDLDAFLESKIRMHTDAKEAG